LLLVLLLLLFDQALRDVLGVLFLLVLLEVDDGALAFHVGLDDLEDLVLVHLALGACARLGLLGDLDVQRVDFVLLEEHLERDVLAGGVVVVLAVGADALDDGVEREVLVLLHVLLLEGLDALEDGAVGAVEHGHSLGHQLGQLLHRLHVFALADLPLLQEQLLALLLGLRLEVEHEAAVLALVLVELELVGRGGQLVVQPRLGHLPLHLRVLLRVLPLAQAAHLLVDVLAVRLLRVQLLRLLQVRLDLLLLLRLGVVVLLLDLDALLERLLLVVVDQRLVEPELDHGFLLEQRQVEELREPRRELGLAGGGQAGQDDFDLRELAVVVELLAQHVEVAGEAAGARAAGRLAVPLELLGVHERGRLEDEVQLELLEQQLAVALVARVGHVLPLLGQAQLLRADPVARARDDAPVADLPRHLADDRLHLQLLAGALARAVDRHELAVLRPHCQQLRGQPRHVVDVHQRQTVEARVQLRQRVALQPRSLEPLLQHLLAAALHDARADHLRLQVLQLRVQLHRAVLELLELRELLVRLALLQVCVGQHALLAQLEYSGLVQLVVLEQPLELLGGGLLRRVVGQRAAQLLEDFGLVDLVDLAVLLVVRGDLEPLGHALGHLHVRLGPGHQVRDEHDCDALVHERLGRALDVLHEADRRHVQVDHHDVHRRDHLRDLLQPALLLHLLHARQLLRVVVDALVGQCSLDDVLFLVGVLVCS